MKYLIIKPDGSNLFELPYELDFCIHCLSCLMNRDIDCSGFRLLSCEMTLSPLSDFVGARNIANLKSAAVSNVGIKSKHLP